jgi:hypothetical protein
VLKYSWDDSSVNFTWQNPGVYNPCFINGVQCNIEKVDANNYKIRQVNGSGALNVAKGTILTSPGNKFRHPDCAIFWCYTNGGYSSASDLIEKIDAMIHHMNPKKFIVVGTYAWSASQVSDVKSMAKALQQHYGDNFFDTELYFTKYALTEVGITPTTNSDFTQEQLNNGALSDTYCIVNGIIPSSFWRFCYGVDSATQNDQHLNAAGYAALAYKLYQIMNR